jgi:hypothetical protein
VVIALAAQPAAFVKASDPPKAVTPSTSVAMSKSDLGSAVVDTVRSTAANLDEVIVSGKLDKLSQVMRAMIAAEDRYWARYNELNKSYDYDVDCFTEAKIGSRLITRKCEAAYLTEARRRDAMALFQGYQEFNAHLQSVNALAGTHLTEMKRRLLANTQNDQKALGALVERFMLQDRYEQLRRKKFDGRRVVWD